MGQDTAFVAVTLECQERRSLSCFKRWMWKAECSRRKYHRSMTNDLCLNNGKSVKGSRLSQNSSRINLRRVERKLYPLQIAYHLVLYLCSSRTQLNKLELINDWLKRSNIFSIERDAT